MAYTDLWRCKQCHELPEIEHVSGKHFVIECIPCKSRGVVIEVEADSIDEVVREWNRLNDPNRRGLRGLITGMWAALTGAAGKGKGDDAS